MNSRDFCDSVRYEMPRHEFVKFNIRSRIAISTNGFYDIFDNFETIFYMKNLLIGYMETY